MLSRLIEYTFSGQTGNRLTLKDLQNKIDPNTGIKNWDWFKYKHNINIDKGSSGTADHWKKGRFSCW